MSPEKKYHRLHLPRHHADLEDTVHSPQRRAELRARGRFAWHVKDAKQGPAMFAIKNHFIAMIGEYVGTVLFMIFALGGTNVAQIPSTSVTNNTAEGQDGSTVTTANTSNLLYIALSFGFSLAVNAWIFFRVSGGLFNPAVSLGMTLVGALTPTRGALLTFSQILGGITGAAILDSVTPGTLNVRTQLGGGTSVAQGLFLEMFLTSLLMIAILLLAAEKHKATFIAPIGIGLALFVAELLGVYYTGGSLNPARSFGPCVVLRSFEGYHWIYWLGPALGAIIASGFYKLLKWLQYETVLGPEDGDTTLPSAGKADKQEEQAAKDATKGGDQEDKTSGERPKPSRQGSKMSTKGPMTLGVQGPGIGDLLTEGPQAQLYDLERQPGPLAYRLDRIETMLEMMMHSQGMRSPSSETSAGTDGLVGRDSSSTAYVPAPTGATTTTGAYGSYPAATASGSHFVEPDHPAYATKKNDSIV